MDSWLARVQTPIPASGETVHFSYQTWSSPMSEDDRVFLVDRSNPTMLRGWGTVTRVDVTERIPVGDDEEANSPPYSTYADVGVTVLCRSRLPLPLGLAEFLSEGDFARFSDGYWIDEEGVVTELPKALGLKISEAIGLGESDRPVFLSYAREDADVANCLHKRLSADGVLVWLDKFALVPGQVWRQEVERAIQQSKAFIALLSECAIGKRGYVQKELRLGLEILSELPPSHIYLIPVRIRPCLPAHPILTDLQWVDLFPDFDEGYARLLAAIRVVDKQRAVGALG